MDNQKEMDELARLASLPTVEPVEYDDDDEEEDAPLVGVGTESGTYNVPVFKGGTVDPSTNTFEDEKPLTAWEVIQQMAKVTGTELRKPNKGCRKCSGRGWTGRELKSQSPIPCTCIFPAKSPTQKAQSNNADMQVGMSSMSRLQRRNLAKKMHSINKRKPKPTETE